MFKEFSRLVDFRRQSITKSGKGLIAVPTLNPSSLRTQSEPLLIVVKTRVDTHRNETQLKTRDRDEGAMVNWLSRLLSVLQDSKS